MDYNITNEYGYKKEYDYLNIVIKKTLELEKIENAIFDITFVDEKKIRKINKEYRNIDKVTDVISFAFEDNEDSINPNLRVLGEIYICIPKMEEQAREYGHSEKRELSFLTVHGLLHLLSYDHLTKEEEKIMFSRQELILNAAKITR